MGSLTAETVKEYGLIIERAMVLFKLSRRCLSCGATRRKSDGLLRDGRDQNDLIRRSFAAVRCGSSRRHGGITEPRMRALNQSQLIPAQICVDAAPV